MGVIDDLLANNEAYSASLPERHLDVRPSRRLAIVTCMDARLDVFSALGLSYGEVHILRNAGGVITDDVIRSLAVSQRRLGTRGVMLIHHTNCGMQALTDDGLEQGFVSEDEWAQSRFMIGARPVILSVEPSVAVMRDSDRARLFQSMGQIILLDDVAIYSSRAAAVHRGHMRACHAHQRRGDLQPRSGLRFFHRTRDRL